MMAESGASDLQENALPGTAGTFKLAEVPISLRRRQFAKPDQSRKHLFGPTHRFRQGAHRMEECKKNSYHRIEPVE